MKMLATAVVVAALACSVGEPPAAGRPGPGAGADSAGDRTAAAVEAPRPGDGEAAAELLERARAAYEATALDSALELAGRVAAAYPASAAAPDARWLAARSAYALGRYEDASTFASRVAASPELSPAATDSARTLAALAADAMKAPAGPALVGAVLPRTGSRILVRYADWVLEGIRLAVQEAERTQGRRIELVVADDGGGVRTRDAIAELERRGVAAVVGPLLPQQMLEAAAARRDDQLMLVSPTVPDLPQGLRRAYTVSGGDVQGAEELGRYAADLVRGRAAILYLNSPEYQRQASAFASSFGGRGGRVMATVPYDSGTTTFGDHLEGILAAVHAAPGERSFALFVAAPQRDVPQIAPQVSFYGLDSAGVQVFGGDSWTVAPVRRLVPDRDLEGVVAISHLPPGQADGLATPGFVHLYEGEYRHTLSNQLPALGYDAAHLLLQALPNRDVSPAATARGFGFLAGVQGATGVLSVRGGQVVHTPFLVVIRSGSLQPAPVPWEFATPAGAASADSVGGLRR